MELVKKSFGHQWMGYSTGVRHVGRALWRVPNPALARPEYVGRIGNAIPGATVLVATLKIQREGKPPKIEEPFFELGVVFDSNAPDAKGDVFGHMMPDTAEVVQVWKAKVKAAFRDARAKKHEASLRKEAFSRTLRSIGGNDDCPLPWEL